MTTRQTLQVRLRTPFSRFEYEALVQQTYARPNSDVMLKDAVLVEAAASEN